jgi:hypothetical protein
MCLWQPAPHSSTAPAPATTTTTPPPRLPCVYRLHAKGAATLTNLLDGDTVAQTAVIGWLFDGSPAAAVPAAVQAAVTCAVSGVTPFLQVASEVQVAIDSVASLFKRRAAEGR